MEHPVDAALWADSVVDARLRPVDKLVLVTATQVDPDGVYYTCLAWHAAKCLVTEGQLKASLRRLEELGYARERQDMIPHPLHDWADLAIEPTPPAPTSSSDGEEVEP